MDPSFEQLGGAFQVITRLTVKRFLDNMATERLKKHVIYCINIQMYIYTV